MKAAFFLVIMMSFVLHRASVNQALTRHTISSIEPRSSPGTEPQSYLLPLLFALRASTAFWIQPALPDRWPVRLRGLLAN